jgi:hypothetical protein
MKHTILGTNRLQNLADTQEATHPNKEIESRTSHDIIG